MPCPSRASRAARGSSAVLGGVDEGRSAPTRRSVTKNQCRTMPRPLTALSPQPIVRNSARAVVGARGRTPARRSRAAPGCGCSPPRSRFHSIRFFGSASGSTRCGERSPSSRNGSSQREDLRLAGAVVAPQQQPAVVEAELLDVVVEQVDQARPAAAASACGRVGERRGGIHGLTSGSPTA